MSLVRPRLADLVVVAAVAGVAVALVLVVAFPPIVLLLAAALVILALPGARRVAGQRLQNAILSDVRDQVALEAAEGERARLAHELHDVPLQHLASAIRRLELIPEARAETERLRVVASQLREAATDLRPPVLEDLGLAAGLEFLASQAVTGGRAADSTVVTADVADHTGPSPLSRPPGDVELAIFRIAQEAVANALRHAGATAVRVSGDVSADRIEVTVRDDGRGITRARERAAAREGHLGLASIRHRAEAIDADLSIEGDDRGTVVRVRWQR